LIPVVPIGQTVPFSIETAGAGLGVAKVTVISPSGKVTPSPVEQTPQGFIGRITAREPGPHEVQVTFNDQPIAKSPFKVMAIEQCQPPTTTDASKVSSFCHLSFEYNCQLFFKC